MDDAGEDRSASIASPSGCARMLKGAEAELSGEWERLCARGGAQEGAKLTTTQIEVVRRMRRAIEKRMEAGGEGQKLREAHALGESRRRQIAAQLTAYRLASRGARVPQAILSLACAGAEPGEAGKGGGGETDEAMDKDVAALVTRTSSASTQSSDPPSFAGTARRFVSERTSRVDRLRSARLADLESLPPSAPIKYKRDAFMHALGLRLLKLQRKVRADLLMEDRLVHECAPHTLFDHSLLRKEKEKGISLTVGLQQGALQAAAIAADKAAKLEEKMAAEALTQARLLDMQRRNAEARRKKQEEFERARAEFEAKMRVVQARRAFLHDAITQRDEMKAARSAARKLRKQRGDSLSSWHSKERKKMMRQANARVLALRSDNIEEYLKMAKEAKDSRVNTLLEKTEGILVELGIKVAEERAAGGQESDGMELFVFDQDKHEDMENSLLAGQQRYMRLVHSRQEPIHSQPSLLLGGKLRNYQLKGLEWMVSLYINGLNGILADEMGLGKTIQTISLVAYLMERKGNYGPHLICCPKAVLSNWTREFDRWLPNLNLVLYDGSPSERKAIVQDRMAHETFNVVLTHYDMIMRDKAVLAKTMWEYIIIDEGHRLKNKDSKLSDMLRNVYLCRNRILLTGTPIQNNLKELWSLLNFVLPRVFDTSDSFDDWFAAPFKGAQEDIALSEEEELLIIHRLHQVIRPFLLRRKKSEVEKELPNKSMAILKCSMSAWQQLYYKQITEHGHVMIDAAKGNQKSRSLMNSAMQLRKACIHPYLFLDSMNPPYEPDDPEELVRASGKFELLDRVLPKLRETGHRVLMFSQMTRAMDLLELYLESREYNYLRLDGETKTNERPLLLAEFNRPGSEVFLFMLSTRAGGLGLNLQTADTVILFDSDWNPQMDKQAEDRAHRIGQKKEVKILTLVTVGSIEEAILKRAREKADIDDKVIQAGMFNQQSSHTERNAVLAEILKKGTDELGKGVTSDNEINELIARSANEVRVFTQMDRDRRAMETKPSLLGEEEVPSWAVSPPEQDEEEETDVLGPRRAKAKQVVYDDGLSDHKWTKLIDDGVDIEQIRELESQKRAGARAKRKSKGEEGAESNGTAKRARG